MAQLQDLKRIEKMTFDVAPVIKTDKSTHNEKFKTVIHKRMFQPEISEQHYNLTIHKPTVLMVLVIFTLLVLTLALAYYIRKKLKQRRNQRIAQERIVLQDRKAEANGTTLETENKSCFINFQNPAILPFLLEPEQ